MPKTYNLTSSSQSPKELAMNVIRFLVRAQAPEEVLNDKLAAFDEKVVEDAILELVSAGEITGTVIDPTKGQEPVALVAATPSEDPLV